MFAALFFLRHVRCTNVEGCIKPFFTDTLKQNIKILSVMNGKK